MRTGNDTVTVYDNAGNAEFAFEHLRQQSDKASGKANYSLADFISRDGNDFLGGFTVSIFGAEALLPMTIRQKAMITVPSWYRRFVTDWQKALPSICMS